MASGDIIEQERLEGSVCQVEINKTKGSRCDI